MKYILSTNEFDSQYITQNKNLDKLLKDLKNKIVIKNGKGRIKFEFIRDNKIVNLKKMISLYNGHYLLMVYYNNKLYKVFSLSVELPKLHFTKDSTLY